VRKNPNRSFSFPGDGAGTGLRVATEYKIPCISGDICPRSLGVTLETFSQTIARTPKDWVVVLSFMLEFLSPEDLQLLQGREVFCIDRHRCEGWKIASSDALITTTTDVKIEPFRDNAVELPTPNLPLYLNNKRSDYISVLDRHDLTKFVRFLQLHKWDAKVRVEGTDPVLKAITNTHFIKDSTSRNFEDTIANDPFHAIDYYTGVSYMDRVIVHGIP